MNNAPSESLRLRTHLRAVLSPASLRVRLTAWSMLFTLLCLGTCGVALNVYLRYALSSSRSGSMHKREHRLVRYLDTDLRERPGLSWQEHLRHFLEATPETDILEIADTDGHRLYPAQDPAPGLPRSAESCRTPCLETTVLDGHHVRVLTHTTTVAERPVRLILIGSVDDHYDILHVISIGFLGLLPFVLVGSALGGYQLSRRALAPIGEMTARARGLSMTHLQGRIPEPGTGDELQELAQAWNDLLTRLEASAINITQFTADASHDLRTAITVIMANAQLALRRPRTPEHYQESLHNIATEAQHTLGILEDLLLASRSGWSVNDLDVSPVDLVHVVREVYDASSASATMRNHCLQLESETEVLWVAGDRLLLRRLVGVLVDNAIKYTLPGGKIQLWFRCSNARWKFEVIDNGIGIPPDLQERAFERLFRVDQARSESSESGHGLGLAIARWIAEAHRFQLELQSTAGAGSTFVVWLPEASAERIPPMRGMAADTCATRLEGLPVTE